MWEARAGMRVVCIREDWKQKRFQDRYGGPLPVFGEVYRVAWVHITESDDLTPHGEPIAAGLVALVLEDFGGVVPAEYDAIAWDARGFRPAEHSGMKDLRRLLDPANHDLTPERKAEPVVVA